MYRFNTWAEPGPIDNSDFVCGHGGVRPERAPHLHHLAALIPQALWEFLYMQSVLISYLFYLKEMCI